MSCHDPEAVASTPAHVARLSEESSVERIASRVRIPASEDPDAPRPKKVLEGINPTVIDGLQDLVPSVDAPDVFADYQVLHHCSKFSSLSSCGLVTIRRIRRAIVPSRYQFEVRGLRAS